jgi:hypothetical protein
LNYNWDFDFMPGSIALDIQNTYVDLLDETIQTAQGPVTETNL